MPTTPERPDLRTALKPVEIATERISPRPASGYTLTTTPQVAYRVVDGYRVDHAERWAIYYVDVCHQTRMSDLVEQETGQRHFTLAGVEFTPGGDFYIVRYPNGKEEEWAVELLLEDGLSKRTA